MREKKLKQTLTQSNKIYISHGGIKHCGKMSTEEVVVDNKGRILIPKSIREKAGLKAGDRARLKLEKGRIIIIPPIPPEEFIKEMEGCITEGPPTIDPLKLKKIWRMTESQK